MMMDDDASNDWWSDDDDDRLVSLNLTVELTTSDERNGTSTPVVGRIAARLVVGSVLAALCLITVLGNTLVIHAVRTDRKLQTVSTAAYIAAVARPPSHVNSDVGGLMLHRCGCQRVRSRRNSNYVGFVPVQDAHPRSPKTRPRPNAENKIHFRCTVHT